MKEILLHWDRELFFLINGTHSAVADFMMYWISNKWIWVPLYLYFILLLWRHYRRGLPVILLFVLVLITLSDQVSVICFKDTFHRLRPCHEPALAGAVHLVRGECGGRYGFVSSHASNTFALATMLTFLLGLRIRHFSLFILAWASLISYSRVYLGVHYPLDVAVGAAWGITAGLTIQWPCRTVLRKYGLIPGPVPDPGHR